MPKQQYGFVIDDAKTTAENLSGFDEQLKEIDPGLAPVLSQYLPQFLSGTAPEIPAIWDALFAATEVQPEGGGAEAPENAA